MKGFMVAADRSGSGKTTVTRALMLALKKNGYTVVPFKCGPDYIDPMYHSQITGQRGHNLDTFFTDEARTRQIFARDMLDTSNGACDERKVAVVEGVMGLYDGLTGFLPEGSSYDLAKALSMPVILCINARGAAQTILAVISGILSYDTAGIISGIFLNEVSDSFFPLLAERIEKDLGIPVIGHLPRDDAYQVKSRHLGLYLPGDSDTAKQDEVLYEEVSKRCNIYNLLNHCVMRDIQYTEPEKKQCPETVIAIARDDAFNFFYRENEMVLEDCGARIVYFSPLSDEKIPDGACGIILPGGYPERHASELRENRAMLTSIRHAVKNGIPMLAECGGFMYLHDSIDGNGPMAGVLDGDCFNTGRSVRFGYLGAYDKGHFFVRDGEEIRGHEFHYYDVLNPGNMAVAQKPASGRRWLSGFCDRKNFLSFMHFYYPSYPLFAGHFVEEAALYGAGKNGQGKA